MLPEYLKPVQAERAHERSEGGTRLREGTESVEEDRLSHGIRPGHPLPGPRRLDVSDTLNVGPGGPRANPALGNGRGEDTR
jgi:hypothetical protein